MHTKYVVVYTDGVHLQEAPNGAKHIIHFAKSLALIYLTQKTVNLKLLIKHYHLLEDLFKNPPLHTITDLSFKRYIRN